MKSTPPIHDSIVEPERRIPVAGAADVVVAGGGPAGCAAAIAAARCGASVILLENCGCLGGIMTSGLMSNVIDSAGKGGFLRELLTALTAEGAAGDYSSFDPETVKVFLERFVREAGIDIRLYSSVVSAVSLAGRLDAVIAESPAGRQAFRGRIFIDCTGDGDLAAHAGCGFEIGNPADREIQAASLCALVYGPKADSIPELCRQAEDEGKRQLLALLTQAGSAPSYRMPTLFRLNRSGYLLMSNQEYQVRPDDTVHLSRATMDARAELYRQISALKEFDPRMANLCLGATASVLGLREGRRIHARYDLTVDDLACGRRQPDAVCEVRFPVDIHHSATGKRGGYDTGNIVCHPYQIPLRSLIARDIRGLLLGGRCIGGDFYAHASYRVLGNAVPTGEAAGICAALAARHNILPEEVAYDEFIGTMNHRALKSNPKRKQKGTEKC